MQCRFAHCRHKTTEIKNGDQYDKVGQMYYHSDCNQERIKLNNIVTLFLEQVNAQVSVPQLRGIVNKLCYDNGYGVDYVEFALQYAIDHPEFRLTYPPGLTRICQSLTIQAEWKKKQDADYEKKISKDAFVAEDVKGTVVKQKDKRGKGFGIILRRK